MNTCTLCNYQGEDVKERSFSAECGNHISSYHYKFSLGMCIVCSAFIKENEPWIHTPKFLAFPKDWTNEHGKKLLSEMIEIVKEASSKIQDLEKFRKYLIKQEELKPYIKECLSLIKKEKPSLFIREVLTHTDTIYLG